MKSILLIALFVLISCETPKVFYDVVSFYKCLLIDSDTVFNQINNLVEAIQTLDPVKLVASFTTVYPAIVVEVTRCSLQASKNVDDDEIILKKTINRNNNLTDFLKAILKIVTPYLESLGINLKKICNDVLPGSSFCNLLE